MFAYYWDGITSRGKIPQRHPLVASYDAPSTPDLSLVILATIAWSQVVPAWFLHCNIGILPFHTLGALSLLKDENTKFSLGCSWAGLQGCLEAQIRVWSRSMVSSLARRTSDFGFPGRGLHSRVFDLLARRLFGFSILYWILVVFYPLSLLK